jgi:hypothetical protein
MISPASTHILVAYKPPPLPRAMHVTHTRVRACVPAGWSRRA